MDHPRDHTPRASHARALPSALPAAHAHARPTSRVTRLRHRLAGCGALLVAVALTACAAGPAEPNSARRSTDSVPSPLVRSGGDTAQAPGDSSRTTGGPGWIDPNI